MITPLDIENKEFTRSKKGYDEEEVDDFLDLIILDYEKLLSENKRLKHQVEELKEQALRTTSPDQSILETLEAAKNLMNDISASAERRAEVLIKNAKLDADSIERDARESVRRLTDEGEALKTKVGRFKERYRQLLADEMDRFEVVSDDLFADLEREFMPASMAQKNISYDKENTRQPEPSGKPDLTKTIIV